jgi:hypothetical protein
MDRKLQRIYDQVAERVDLAADENPVLNRVDALNLAYRNRILYRHAQDGNYYDLRWTTDSPIERVPVNHLCLVICNKIIETYEERELLEWEGTEEKATADVVEGRMVKEDVPVSKYQTLEFPITEKAWELAVALSVSEIINSAEGTGKNGTITVNDVKAFAASVTIEDK